MFELLKRMAATVFAILQTRAELLAIEVEEEVLRLFSYLILSAIALICFGVTALLVILLVVIAFWDSYRVAAVLGLICLFGFTSLGIAMHVRKAIRTKPRFLAATLGELQKDADMLAPAKTHSASMEADQ